MRALGTTDIAPYVSVVLLEVAASQTRVGQLVHQAVSEFCELLTMTSGRSLETRRVRRSGQANDEGFVHFLVRKSPTWLLQRDDVVDMRNELFAVVRSKRRLGVACTDPETLEQVVQRCTGAGKLGLEALRLIPPDQIETAFLRGPTKTLWLSGIHRRSAHRADAKVLAGQSLEDALDPLADQTFYFTAARSAVPGSGKAVGVNPSKSRVWTASSSNWNSFCNEVRELLASVPESAAPGRLPVLASPSRGSAPSRAYDVSLVAPEILEGTESNSEAWRLLAERWAHRATYEVIGDPDKPDFDLEVKVDELDLGRTTVTVSIAADGRVRFDSSWAANPGEAPECEAARGEFDRIVRNHGRWVTVHYDGDHTISNGRVFSVRYRDVEFLGWKWRTFKKKDICKEKPMAQARAGRKTKYTTDLAQVGHSDSLFCWVVETWKTGWLACDDGPGEIADFVHFDPKRKALTLIHVKAAQSGSENRQISTSAYEVVVGQAVKNIRHLDQVGIAGALEEPSDTVAGLVWKNGEKQTNRQGMIKAVKAGTVGERRVVIVQPHIQKRSVDEARAKQTHSVQRGRLRQLETMLVAASASCRAVGAELEVVGAR